jgi:hypothetical protein
MTGINSTVEYFRKLVSTNLTYAHNVCKLLGIEKLDVDVMVGGLFRGSKFIPSPFVCFVTATIIQGQEEASFAWLFRSLKSSQPDICKKTLFKLEDNLANMEYEGLVAVSAKEPYLIIPNTNHPISRLYKFGEKQDLGWKIVGSRMWLCLIGNRFGEGTSPTIALRNCGADGEVSSKYIRLRKEGLI